MADKNHRPRADQALGRCVLGMEAHRQSPDRSNLHGQAAGFAGDSSAETSMATAARAAAATTTTRRTAGDTATAHDTRSTNRHTAHRLAAVRMLRQCGVLHALANLKTLRLVAFKLGDGFVNVGGHGNGKRGVKGAKVKKSQPTDQQRIAPLSYPAKKTASPGQETPPKAANIEARSA